MIKKILFILVAFNLLFSAQLSMDNIQMYAKYKDILQNTNGKFAANKQVEIAQPNNNIQKQLSNEDNNENEIENNVEKNIFVYDKKEKPLKRYGESFFSNENQLDPSYIPTSLDYVLKSADRLMINTYGSSYLQQMQVDIDNNGNIFLDKIGTIKVASKTFSDAKLLITKTIQKSFPNTKVIVDIIKYSTIQVVLSGNVKIPGIYNLSPFATVKNALLKAGGLLDIGSYRDITIIRDKKVVYKFDLYKLLLNPNKNSDFILRDQDIVMVNFIKKAITLKGKVKYPAIYELNKSETFKDLLHFSGGLQFDATKNSIKLTRYDNNKKLKTYILTQNKLFKMIPKDGDIVEVFNRYDLKEKPYIFVHGKVVKDGIAKYQYFDGITISQLYKMVTFRSELYNNLDDQNLQENNTTNSDLDENQNDNINQNNVAQNNNRYNNQNNNKYNNQQKNKLLNDTNKDDIKKDSLKDKDIKDREALFVDTQNIKIIRHNSDKKNIFLVSVDDDFVLKPFDEVEFFNYFDTHPRMEVTIIGEVYKSGKYFIDESVTLDKLIHLAGGMTKKAYTKYFELVRYKVVNDERIRDIKRYKLKEMLKSHFKLQPYDEINIFTIPNWYDSKTITVKGEVKFPGTYSIKTGEKLSDVIKRAGGFTQEAFIQGAVFTRESIKENENKRMKEAMFKLKQQITFISANAKTAGSEKKNVSELMGITSMLEKQMKEYKALGRLVVYLDKDLSKFQNTPYNIRVEDKDTLIIPSFNDTVSVYGEVMNPNSFIYTNNDKVLDYIKKAGGLTQRADKESVYMILANGEAKKVEIDSLFVTDQDVKRGSTIVVPMQVNRVSNILLWKEVSQIVYQLAITAASLNTVGAL